MVGLVLRDRDDRFRGIAFLDAEDYDQFAGERWNMNRGGYASRADKGKGTKYMHREVLGLRRGDGKHVDHINGNRLDNRRANLRVCTNAENQQNRRAGYGSSSHRGVSWHADAGKWRAHVQLNGKVHYFGLHETEEAAAEVAREGRRKLMPFSET